MASAARGREPAPSRDEGFARSTEPGAPQAGAAAQVPRELMRSRMRNELLGVVLLGGVVLAVPSILGDRLIPVLVTSGIWGIAALGVGLLLGRAGQISLGHGALVAVGAYGAGLSSANLGWNAWAALAMSVLAGLLVALLTSPILRLQGHYFTLGTLALALMVAPLLTAQRGRTGGAAGLLGIGSLQLGILDVQSEDAFFVLVWAVALLLAATTVVVLRGSFGRALDAAANDAATAVALGISVARVRMAAWILSGMFAGLAGGLYTFYTRFLAPDQFTLRPSILVLAAAIVGGSRSAIGPLVGLLVLEVVPVWLDLSPDLTSLTTPVLLVVFAVLLPSGIVPTGCSIARRAGERLRRGGRP